MKKFFAIIAALVMISAASALSASAASDSLVVVFSHFGVMEDHADLDAVSNPTIVRADPPAGNAQVLGDLAAEILGADLFEVKSTKRYPKEYRPTVERAREELAARERPPIESTIDTSRYSKIIVVYPLWWNTLPMPLFTFLSGADLAGKKIALVCTHGGSRLGRSVLDVREACPGAQVDPGFAVWASDTLAASTREQLAAYLKGL